MKLEFDSISGRGIIYYLVSTGRKYLIEINATKYRENIYLPDNAIDLNYLPKYGSITDFSYNQYFHIHLKKFAIKIKAFMLHYYNSNKSANCYPKSYQFSASNGINTEFKLLYNVSNDTTLGDMEPHIFPIPNNKQNIYTDFKITNKGLNGCNNTPIHISEIDFFGIVYSEKLYRITCQYHFNIFPVYRLLTCIFIGY